MEPMFLPEVERRPEPGPYGELIRMAQARGGEYSQIWHLFAFRSKAGDHLSRHPGDHARPSTTQPRDARADRRLHFLPKRLPILNQVPRRGRGGIAGQRRARLGRAARP